MSMIRFSMKHGLGEREACERLEKTVGDVTSRFGGMVKQINWATDRRSVNVVGTGFTASVRIDAQDVHVEGDVGMPGGLMGGKIAERVKELISQRFKALPPGGGGNTGTPKP
jgi:hypothetical protein